MGYSVYLTYMTSIRIFMSYWVSVIVEKEFLYSLIDGIRKDGTFHVCNTLLE